MDFFLWLRTFCLKYLSSRYGQKLLDSAKKKSATYAIKTVSKRAVQKTAEATGELISNKIADKVTSASKKSSAEHSKKLQNNEAKDETEIPKERNISPEKRQQIIDESRLV